MLVGVDLGVATGDFIGVVGPSGSGKTTLIRALVGAVVPTAGRVTRSEGLSISYVRQTDTVNWDFPLTVEECVLMGRSKGRILPWASRSEREEVSRVLDLMGMLPMARRHIADLSGGQRQRLFLARALMRRPQLLLMDEPTSEVDLKTRHEVLHLLDDLNREGMSIVLTTHDLNGIAAHLPWLVCLNREVIGAGPPHQVLTTEVLERTYGARMDVLQHGGLPVVLDQYGGPRQVPLSAG